MQLGQEDINVTVDLEGEANTRDDIIANSVEGETVARQLNAVANINKLFIIWNTLSHSKIGFCTK